MTAIRIDRKRCTRCGLCVEDCTSRVFRMQESGPVVVHPDNCNRCSHCLAVCPVRAVIHPGLGEGHPPRIRRADIRARVLRETARSRRSVRRYKPEAIPRELLEEILDTARFAPTASNAQNVRYTVITRPALLAQVSRRIFRFGDAVFRVFTLPPVERARRMLGSVKALRSLERYGANWMDYREQVEQGRDLILHHAPVLLLLHTPRGEGFGRENCMIAAALIDQYAHALGLGACFIGILTTAMRVDPALGRMLGVPAGHRVHAALTLGVPAFRYTYHALRNTPRVHWVTDEG